MPIEVFDFRNDVRNVLVTPQIRSRFLRMEPGEVASRHSHDVGVEVFLILAGSARFEIDGEVAVLEPGQMCVALPDQPHQVSVVGDEPMTMYLSVTPHLQPTHTGRDADGERDRLRFLPSSAYDVDDDVRAPIEDLIDKFIDLAEDLSAVAATAAQEQRMAGARLARALTSRNLEAADRQREIMWFGIFRLCDKLYQMTQQWNRLAPRAGHSG